MAKWDLNTFMVGRKNLISLSEHFSVTVVSQALYICLHYYNHFNFIISNFVIIIYKLYTLWVIVHLDYVLILSFSLVFFAATLRNSAIVCPFFLDLIFFTRLLWSVWVYTDFLTWLLWSVYVYTGSFPHFHFYFVQQWLNWISHQSMAIFCPHYPDLFTPGVGWLVKLKRCLRWLWMRAFSASGTLQLQRF